MDAISWALALRHSAVAQLVDRSSLEADTSVAMILLYSYTDDHNARREKLNLGTHHITQNSGAGTNLKVGGRRSGAKVGGTDPAQSAEKKFRGCAPPLFWL